MSDMKDLDSYYTSLQEPGKRQKYQNWETAKGLQQVDGLSTSAYLDEVARRNIEGDITSYEAAQLIDSYYDVKSDRDKEAEYKEADTVASRINILIEETGFSLEADELRHIHRRLFEGVFDHAGDYRSGNIAKREWVLDGDSVIYGDYHYIPDNLERYIRRERLTSYAKLDKEEILTRLSKCISDIWQVHPFSEGNTRTVAVFAIKYFRYLGFEVDNTVFQNNSWYFRNALVRANYVNVRKHIDLDRSFLEGFLSCILFYTSPKEFHNRDLHIYATTLPTAQVNHGKGLDALLQEDIAHDNTITRREMAIKHGVTEKTIERHLKGMGIRFEGASKTGHWVLPMPGTGK